MAGGTSAAPGDVNSEPNVIPMIDIMLVMLIIFMVSQPLSRMALDVQVPPQEQATKSNAQSNQIVLELLEDGGYAINTQPVPLLPPLAGPG
jgi:biopolymer transport protein ExbD